MSVFSTPDGTAVTYVTVVHTDACHFCEDAQDALAEIARELPLRLELIPATSAAGAQLVRAHRPAMFPLVLVDGAYFSVGRLPRRKLRTVLAGRRVVTAR